MIRRESLRERAEQIDEPALKERAALRRIPCMALPLVKGSAPKQVSKENRHNAEGR